MPAEKLSMRKIKEVLRLKFELGFANRQIARSCKVSHSTVADYLRRAEAAGLNSWPLPADLDETSLEARLFPPTEAGFQSHSVPNWPAIHEDLHSHKHVTLQLVDNDELGISFPMHEVTIIGAGLQLLLADVAAQRIGQLHEPSRADQFEDGRVPCIREIRVAKNGGAEIMTIEFYEKTPSLSLRLRVR